MQQREERLMATLRQVTGGEASCLVYAPGRAELGGNHTDHNGGRVLASSVDLNMCAAALRSEDRLVRILSTTRPELTVDLQTLGIDDRESGSSRALVRGVANGLWARGFAVGGFTLAMDSEVLTGSGLSSSAAFENLIGATFSGLYNEAAVDPVTLALVGQEAENRYFGKPSGLMDQLASGVGGVIGIDFENEKEPQIQRLNFDFAATGTVLVIVDTKSSHANLTPAYAAITQEMQEVASHFSARRLRDVQPARFYAAIAQLRALGNDRAILRAHHFFSENERVTKQLEALQKADFKGFLRLVNESGRASERLLQNTAVWSQPKTQPLNLALALSEYFLAGEGATRVQGGGFAGTIQTYVPRSRLADYVSFMESALGPDCCQPVRLTREGVRVVPL